MGKINVLSKSVAEKIAAGEVVERPASVVKELLENAIDANATSITVEIKNGGVTYIRITDNGSGMDPIDAKTAFLRHATSKILSEKDLEAINTLGFRGEALCSIAAVSEVEMYTKTYQSTEGYFVKVMGGEFVDESSIGCPDGTTITVKNLFYNTPARMKFLKKDQTEAGYVADICQRVALSRPDISIKLINNGKEVFFTPGDFELLNAIYPIFGSDYAKKMVKVDYKDKGMHLYGYIGKSELSRPNRNMQLFFVNGRTVMNKTLTFAFCESYKNMMMTGRFPVGVLNIDLPSELVDVNVHPAKTEVKFANEQIIYDLIYWGTKNSLHNSQGIKKLSDIEDNIPNQNKLLFIAPKSTTIQQKITEKPHKLSFTSIKIADEKDKAKQKAKVRENEIPYKAANEEGKVEKKEAFYKEIKKPINVETKQEIIDNNEIIKQEIIIPEYKIVGQLFKTYIIIEVENEMLMIDQHAAHERIRFERLKEEFLQKGVSSQILMVPKTITLTKIEYDTAIMNLDLFTSLGFVSEDFGNNSIVVRTVPSDVDFSLVSDAFIEILNLILNGAKEKILEISENALKMIACKSSIKANGALKTEEITKLVDEIFCKDLKTCPHGRPIIVKLSKYQIEKMFKRII